MNRASGRPALIWALALAGCIVGFVSIAWLIGQPGIPPLDRAVSDLLHGLSSAGLDAFMSTATILGATLVLASVAALAAILLALDRQRSDAAFVVVALAGSVILNE